MANAVFTFKRYFARRLNIPLEPPGWYNFFNIIILFQSNLNFLKLEFKCSNLAPPNF